MESVVIFNIILNFVYAGVGGLLCVPLMIFAYKMFDKSTPVDVEQELCKGNIAVGIVTGCLILGIALCTGLVVGLGLN